LFIERNEHEQIRKIAGATKKDCRGNQNGKTKKPSVGAQGNRKKKKDSRRNFLPPKPESERRGMAEIRKRIRQLHKEAMTEFCDTQKQALEASPIESEKGTFHISCGNIKGVFRKGTPLDPACPPLFSLGFFCRREAM
jgi:hypothetical protein